MNRPLGFTEDLSTEPFHRHPQLTILSSSWRWVIWTSPFSFNSTAWESSKPCLLDLVAKAYSPGWGFSLTSYRLPSWSQGSSCDTDLTAAWEHTALVRELINFSWECVRLPLSPDSSPQPLPQEGSLTIFLPLLGNLLYLTQCFEELPLKTWPNIICWYIKTWN